MSDDQAHLVASGVVSVFKSIWRDSWGPRMEYILYAAVAALLECENVTLLGLQRMLVDDGATRLAPGTVSAYRNVLYML